jgi:hypothetical protein
MTALSRHIIVFVLLATMSACQRNASPPTPLHELPITMTVPQRSTTAVPGSAGLLFIRTGDVTMGQVTVTLSDGQSATLLPTQSMYSGDERMFGYAGTSLQLRLDTLSNALIGQDYATFTISPQRTEADGDQARTKIESLLDAIASLRDATFLRNGQAYTPTEAVAHLRGKWEAAGMTLSAREFVEQIASRSSTTGEPYLIRYADGRTEALRDFLLARL